MYDILHVLQVSL